MNIFWLSVISGIISGFIVSFIFLLILYHFCRPSIKIGNSISSFERSISFEDGEIKKETLFGFKFINTGRFPLYDVKINLLIGMPNHSAGGRNVSSKSIPLITNSFHCIKARIKKNRDSPHCVIVATTYDLRKYWNSESSILELGIVARHGVSGLPKIYNKEFFSNTDIKKGRFHSGETFEIS